MVIAASFAIAVVVVTHEIVPLETIAVKVLPTPMHFENHLQ